MRVLVVNAGSSSVKLRLLGPDDATLAAADLAEGAGARFDEEIGAALARMPAPDAVGHRVVHGGREFVEPVRLDEAVIHRLEALTALAPLHQPASLAGIGAVGKALPGVPAVACFDTAFHHDLPEAAATYPLPAAWRERHGVRRYGFHGLSHAYAWRRAVALLAVPEPEAAGLRLVSCHLGAGASLAAVAGGRSVDTTMGFTPLDGLVMATRSGSLDPGLVLWLQERLGCGARELGRELEHGSGLLGLTGHADMRRVITAADAGDPRARLGLAVYVHRLRAGIAAMTAALGGLDVLVFTGGVGERAPRVRALAAAGLAFLGVALDEASNAGATADAGIGAAGAAVRALVVTSREDLEIATGVRAVLRG